MPYSRHEKSGLASVPIDPERVVKFSKKMAEPEKAKVKYPFLDRKDATRREGKDLLEKALRFDKKEEDVDTKDKEFEAPSEAISEEFFPPCIKDLSKIKDGRKRSLFILTNFLASCGWNMDEIERYLKEWNKKLEEPLREVMIVGQVRYQKQRKKRILPPNCANKMYYMDMQICNPDPLCKRIKNPVNYCFIRSKNKKK